MSEQMGRWKLDVYLARSIRQLALGSAVLALGCGGTDEINEGNWEQVAQPAVTATPIRTLAELRAMSVTGNYALANDIDASATGSTPFVPIGSSSSPFRGTFDGKNFRINNLTIAGNRTYAGMFGYASGATLSNIRLTNAKLTNGATYTYTGALVGYMTATSLYDSQVTGAVSGGTKTGGVVGYATGSTVSGLSASGLSVTGTNEVGGLVGYINASTFLISCSTSGGSVTGRDSTGGLVGRVNNSSLSYSSGTRVKVTGTTNTGGLTGYASSATIYSDSVTGDVTGTGTTGGLVGRLSGSASRRGQLLMSNIDNKAVNTASLVQGTTPVGMGIGLVQSYTDVMRSAAVGKVSGATNTIGGFIGEINAPGTPVTGDEPRAMVEEIYTKVEVSPTFDSSSTPVYAGGLVGKMLGAAIEHVNVAGTVKGRQYVGGAIGYAINTGTNVAASIVGSVLTRGEVTNVTTPNRSGVIGGANGNFYRCGKNYWDTTTDSGSAPPLPGEEAWCQMAQTSAALKSPERVYLDPEHPNGNFEIFIYGLLVDHQYLADFGGDECQLGSGGDGDFGFGFCFGIIPNQDPPVWSLNSSTEYNTLINVYNPSGQAKN
jgi:hypothetical protein